MVSILVETLAVGLYFRSLLEAIYLMCFFMVDFQWKKALTMR